MNAFLQRRLASFWWLNGVAWLSYGIVSFAGALPYVGQSAHLDSIRTLLVNRAAFAGTGLLITSVSRLVLLRNSRSRTSLLRYIWCALPFSFAAAILTTAIANIARLAAGGHLVEGWAGIFGGTVTGFAVYLCWCATYFAVQAHQEMQVEQQNALRALATAKEAQWTALRCQLNPHFLFNSLNSVQALIQENPARARTAVGDLASLLRYSLRQSGGKTVPLEEEIGIIRKYLSIEETRFEENLVVSVEIQPEAAQIPVPGFLLHPLVENAVRYGMHTSAIPLQVFIRASSRDGNLRLEVANTGRWLAGDEADRLGERNGIGLRLVREQLGQNYPGRHHASCSVENGWVVQRIEIAGIAREECTEHALSRAVSR